MARRNGTLRIGFIGAGGIVRQRHAPGLRQQRDVELVGVVNSSPQSTARAAQEYGIPRQFETPEQLIQSDDVDIVWIGTQPYLHSKLSIAALEAGKHVFCQARMALDYADAKRMYEAWRKTDLTANICAPPHYMRGDRVIRRMIADGFLGTPYNVIARAYHHSGGMDYHDASKPLHWRQMGNISGVNVLDMGMLVEVVHRWLGFCRNVAAQTAIHVPERPPANVNQGTGQTKVDSPDTITTAANMENGALFSGLWSGVAQFGDEPNAIEMFGSKGTIRYLSGTDAPGSGKILAAKVGDAGLREVSVPDSEALTWTVEADFISAVREGKRDPEPSFFDGLKYMEFTDAAVRSAAEGRRIDLPYEKEL